MTLSFDPYMQQKFESALRLAANGGHSSIVEMLITAGAPPESLIVIICMISICVVLNARITILNS